MHSSNSISILRVYTSVERLYSRVTHKHGCMHTCMWCTKSITTLVASSYHLATRVVSQFTNSCRATVHPGLAREIQTCGIYFYSYNLQVLLLRYFHYFGYVRIKKCSNNGSENVARLERCSIMNFGVF